MVGKITLLRTAYLAFALAVVAGTPFAAAQPTSLTDTLSVEERSTLRQTLREARRAERQAARDAERVVELESELAFLESALMITIEQAVLWEPVADALRSDQAAQLQARQSRRARRNSLAGPPSFPEQLEEDRTELAARIERLDDFMSAFRPLYAAFNAEQRFVADRLLEIDDGEVRIDDYD